MKTIIAFSTVEEVYKILGWECPEKYWEDPSYEKLWDAGFDFDDWDGGFACKEPLNHTVTDEEYGDTWTDWDDDVEWLGQQMYNYCVGYNYCEFEGWHWYTVHHS